MAEIIAKQEGIIALYKDSELVAIVKQNGKIEHYKVTPMNFGELNDLYESNKASN